jgi:hypothetical protein
MDTFKSGVAEHTWTTVVSILVRCYAIMVCAAIVIGALPDAAQASRSAEVWHDELTIKEVVSGKVTPYNGHEVNIPGDVIADKMSSKADAQALWGPQGGRVTNYTGCGECGVGSSITVVVEYSAVIDTHVFKRNKDK